MLAAAVLALFAAPAQAATTAPPEPWSSFPAFVWRLRTRGEAPPEELRAFGGFDVKRGEDADRTEGFATYVGHAPGRDELHLDADSPVWREPWDAWVAAGATRGAASRSGADPLLVREPCLSSDETTRKLDATLAATLARHAQASPWFVSLGDEVSLTPSQGVPWDGCRSDDCRARWERLHPGAPMPTTDDVRRAWTAGDASELGVWLALRRFHRGVVEDQVLRLAERVRAGDAPFPTALLGTIGATPFGGVDLARVLPRIDVVECYPEGDARADVETFRTSGGRSKPSLRSLRTVFVADDTPDGAAWQVSEHWVRGGDGVVVWCDGDLLDLPEHAERLLAALSVVDALPRDFLPAPAGVAVLRDDDSRALAFLAEARLDGATWPNRFPSYQREHGLVETAVESWLRTFEDLGYHPGGVRFDTLDAERFPVVVLPHVLVAGVRDEAALKGFLDAGGVLLVEGELGTHDRDGRPAARRVARMTTRLERAFPPRVVRVDNAGYAARRLRIDGERRRAVLPEVARSALAARGHAPLPITSADGTPWLVTRQRLADGRVWVAAVPNLVTPDERARLADARVAPPSVPDGMRLVWRSPLPADGASEVVVPAGAPLFFELVPDR